MNTPSIRIRRRVTLSALLALVNLAVAAPEGLPPPPAPMGVQAAGPVTDGPYQPQAIVPGGVVVPLYPAGSPYLNQDRIHEAENYGTYNAPFLGYMTNIHNPSIEFHAASGALNTGSAVIIAAGGGHNTLGVAGEGAAVVPYFTNRGINAIILRNRLRSDGYDPRTDAVYDMQQGIKLVRAYAKEWRIDPDRIGVIGFSAGAELVAGAALRYDAFDAKNDVPGNPLAKISSRPDFAALVYPGPSPFFMGATEEIPRDAPPTFFTGPGWGDWIHALWATEYFTALLNDGVPNVEIHIYARGVHPGDNGKEGQAPATSGITSRDGVGFGTWQERYLDWLDDLGFMAKGGAKTRAAIDVEANLGRESPYATMQARTEARRARQAAQQGGN